MPPYKRIEAVGPHIEALPVPYSALTYVHAITIQTAYRMGQSMFRYVCRCGKKGKYQKSEALTNRGAKLHVRAFTPKPQ